MNRDSQPSDTGSRGHSDPMGVDPVNSLPYDKGKGPSRPRGGCFKCGAHFQPDCNARRGNGKQSSGKGEQSKSLPQSDGKGKSKAEGLYKGKNLETSFSGLENPKSETCSETQESAQTYPTDNAYTTIPCVMMAGVAMDGR